MTVPEILRGAAQRVRRGWTRGRYADGHGVCAVGALCVASGVSERLLIQAGFRRCSETFAVEFSDAGLYFTNYVRSDANDGVIARWNDAQERTAEDVAVALEFAALLYEQEHAQPSIADPQEIAGVLA